MSAKWNRAHRAERERDVTGENGVRRRVGSKLLRRSHPWFPQSTQQNPPLLWFKRLPQSSHTGNHRQCNTAKRWSPRGEVASVGLLGMHCCISGVYWLKERVQRLLALFLSYVSLFSSCVCLHVAVVADTRIHVCLCVWRPDVSFLRSCPDYFLRRNLFLGPGAGWPWAPGICLSLLPQPSDYSFMPHTWLSR